MTLWEQIMKTPTPVKERLLSQYGEVFPLEVRCYLADFIEEKVL